MTGKTARILSALLLVAAVALVSVPIAGDAQGKGTIKIATQSPLSGGQSALGEGIKLGTELAVEKFKGNLEKAGFKVQLVPFDDQAKPDVGVANAKNIIADKDIMVVIGHLNSGVAIPSSEVYKEVNLAMISPANTNEKVTDRGYPNVNRVCGRDDVQGAVGAEFASTGLKAKTVYIIHDKTTYGQGVAEAFKADVEKKGAKVVAFEGTEEKSNFDPIVTPIKAKNPDLVYFGGIYDQGAPFFKQAREKGVKSKFLGPDGMDSSDLTKIGGKAVVGMYYTTAAAPDLERGRQAVRRGVQEEVQEEPGAVRGGVVRGHGHRVQGAGERDGGRQGADARRGHGGDPQGEVQRPDRRHRVRRQGRPEEGDLLRAAGRQREPGEVVREQGSEAPRHRRSRGEEVTRNPAGGG